MLRDRRLAPNPPRRLGAMASAGGDLMLEALAKWCRRKARGFMVRAVAALIALTPNPGSRSRLLKHIECDHERLLPLQAYVPGRIPLAGVAHQHSTVRQSIHPVRWPPVGEPVLGRDNLWTRRAYLVCRAGFAGSAS
jgi:hypothetical protein